jgi:hypothetical protein
MPVPCLHLMLFPSSNPWFCSFCHRGLLTCKSCNMSSSVPSGTSASLGSGMDCDPISYRSSTIVLLLVMDLAFLLHVLREYWTFVLMVSFYPTCGAPNKFSFVLVLVLV